jgi:hypothetical protein
MADFQPFNLGSVLQTAEAIKAARAQSTTDRLREQYLGEQIKAAQADRVEKERLQKVTLGKEKAQQVAVKTGQILQAENPKNYIEQAEPDLIKQLTANGVDWATADDNDVRQMITAMQNHANQELGVAPLQSQQVGGATVITQGGQYKSAINPRPATDNTPMAYREHILAQKDPEFRKFLESRKGKGLSVTLPDGTTVEMGGSGGGIGPSELSKPTINALQETIVNSSNRLDRLNQLFTSYKPEYLQAKGLVKAATSEAKDFLGMDVSEEDKKFLAGYSEFRATASQEFSATLKELSGSAATEAEVQRVMKGVPSDKDKSPTAFEAKARATTKFITRAIMRANWALKNGIGVQSVDELSKRMPLEGIDGVYEARANQIWQELGGTPETKTQAIEEANKEFGLAR